MDGPLYCRAAGPPIPNPCPIFCRFSEFVPRPGAFPFLRRSDGLSESSGADGAAVFAGA